jgi:hypothetical protein
MFLLRARERESVRKTPAPVFRNDAKRCEKIPNEMNRNDAKGSFVTLREAK